MKEKQKNMIKNYLEKRISTDDPNPFGWPPTCSGLLYQPERLFLNKERYTEHNKHMSLDLTKADKTD